MAFRGFLYRALPPSQYQRATADTPYGTLNLWAHWDGECYSRLALDGCLVPPDGISPALFPLYSLLSGSLARLFGGPLSIGTISSWGVLVSLLTLPFALYFVYRMAEDGWGAGVARGAVLTLAFFPTSFYLNTACTESLSLALSAGALWAASVRRDLLLACLLAALAAATRNVGIFLLVPLAFERWREREEYGRSFLYLALIPSGLLLYMAYLWWCFGDPLLFCTDQKGWGREAGGPLDALAASWKRFQEGSSTTLHWISNPDHPPMTVGSWADHVAAANAYDLISLSLATALLNAGLAPPRPLTLRPPAHPRAGPLWDRVEPAHGHAQVCARCLPALIVLGDLLKYRRDLAGWLLVRAAASLLLCALFVSWRYVA